MYFSPLTPLMAQIGSTSGRFGRAGAALKSPVHYDCACAIHNFLHAGLPLFCIRINCVIILGILFRGGRILGNKVPFVTKSQFLYLSQVLPLLREFLSFRVPLSCEKSGNPGVNLDHALPVCTFSILAISWHANLMCKRDHLNFSSDFEHIFSINLIFCEKSVKLF